MRGCKFRGYLKATFLWAILGAAAYPFCTSRAQVATNLTPDGTLGTTVTRAGGTPRGGTAYMINDGTIRDGNQFHSFDRFSVGTLDAALFNAPAGSHIQNILTRVTGHLTGPAPSQIDGFLVSLVPGANVFLMNPAGIIFEPNAQLDVSGSFHATTADYISLGTDGAFYANPADPKNVLTASPPSAFGFLSASPAAIDVNTTGFLVGATGQTLSFVGGPVNIGAADGSAPGFVWSPSGRLNLVSLASSGQALFDGTGFDVDGKAQLGTINIRGGSVVDGKGVFIRGGRLTIDDGSVFPGILNLLFLNQEPDGGQVDVKVQGDLSITGTSIDPHTQAAPGIFVFSGNPFQLPAGPGKLPDINIQAGTVSISGIAAIQSQRLGPGDAGNVTINADTVSTAHGGSIALFNGWEGTGGNLTINAKDIQLSGDGTSNGTGFEGLAAQGIFHPAYALPFTTDPELADGLGGNIVLNASATLTMSGQAQITTDSLNLGRSGDITINAGDVLLVGAGTQTGVIGAQSFFEGDAGNITLSAAGTIDIQNGFRISSSTYGSGSAGDVTLNAGRSITFTGADSRVLSLTAPQSIESIRQIVPISFHISYDVLVPHLGLPADGDVFAMLGALTNDGFLPPPVNELKAGDAGTVTLNTPLLTMNADTLVQTSTAWDGNAGGIIADVGSAFLADGAAIESTSGATSREGQFFVGSGNAGSVNVTATDTLLISGTSPSTGEGSKISTTTYGPGNGGIINLNANDVLIANGGIVSSDSLATNLAGTDLGRTGDVNVTAGHQIYLNDGTISTRAVTADGGNITLKAPSLIRLSDSQITTSVQSGLGKGGNIYIDPQFLVLSNGQITANAFGGPGGNVNIVADNFLFSPDSLITASSALSTQGTVLIQSPENDIAGSIAQLAQAFLDASSRLRGRCAAERTGAQSTFVLAGRGGVTVNPDGYLPSSGMGTGPTNALARGGDAWPQEELTPLAEASCAR